MTDPDPDPVLAVTRWKTNAAMIADVARLGYLDGRVLDPTVGTKAGFWKVWRPDNLTTHDLKTDGVDFRHLPYPAASFDSITLDGPYKLNGTPNEKIDGRYGVDVRATRDGRHQLICDGMTECARVLAPSGFLLVKCQDQVEGGKVRWQTDIFTDHAKALGLAKVDSFVYLGGRAQPKDRKRKDGTLSPQAHARRNCSTLLVFQAPKVWPIPPVLPVAEHVCPHCQNVLDPESCRQQRRAREESDATRTS